jgi:DNA-binding beta-propeller fold protein YncE
MHRLIFGAAAAAVVLSAGAANAQFRILGVDGSRLVEIDGATGASTQIATLSGPSFSPIGALAYDPFTDTLYGASSSNTVASLFTINRTTGAVSLVGSYGVGSVFMHGLEFNAQTRRLYSTSSSSTTDGVLYELNPATGAATVIGAMPGRRGFGSLGFNTSTGVMYWADTTSDELYTINLATAATTLVGPLGVTTQVGAGLAYHPTIGMLAVNNSGTDTLSVLNLSTGAATLIGNTGTSNMLAIAVIPAPAPLALLGLAGLAASRRRR